MFGQWIVNAIVSICPLSPDNGHRHLLFLVTWWQKFSLKSACSCLESGNQFWNPKDKVWDLVWKWRGPQRIKTFLWLAVHNGFLTNGQRFHRKLTANVSCILCSDSAETVLQPSLHGLEDWDAVFGVLAWNKRSWHDDRVSHPRANTHLNHEGGLEVFWRVSPCPVTFKKID
jgi:hypothetical protein